MRHRRCIVSALTTLSIALNLLGATRLPAATAPDEYLALGNGAGLYAVYCSDCHGNAPAPRQAGPSATDPATDYAELVAIAQRKVAEDKVANTEEEEWPEWSDRPNPYLKEEPDEREEIMSLITAAIEKGHAIEPRLEGDKNSQGNAGALAESTFNPVPGATDLSKPQTFYYGTSEEEVFKSIANGTGAAMPGWRTELGGDDAIWDVVRFIRSFWSEEWL